MIFCEKINNYVDQDNTCIKKCCIFYEKDEDSCWYPEWNPGLKKGRNLENE